MLTNESIAKLLKSCKEIIQVCQTASLNIHTGMPQDVLDEDQNSLCQQIAKAIVVYQEVEAVIAKQESFLSPEKGEITLSQVVRQLQRADAIIIDDVVLYGSIDGDSLRLSFSWEEEGETVEVEINEDNVVSIEATSSTEIKIIYNGDDYSFISKLDKTEFNFS